MKGFKSHISFIYEELSPEQKEIVNGWYKGKPLKAQEISKHLPYKNGRLSFPISDNENSEFVLPEVKNHLQSKGYKPISFSHAIDDSGKRTMKIGKLLSDKPDLQKKHAVEGTSGPENLKDYMVTASYHPHDIAGMSTGQKWTSCMDFGQGCNRHFLPKEIESGTHVFYLHHKDDPEMKKPIARLAVKPYTSPNGHTTLAVDKNPTTYGFSLNTQRGKRNNQVFLKNVSDFVSKNYPLKDAIYQKDSKVYDDENFFQDKPRAVITKDKLDSDSLMGLLKDKKHFKMAIHHPSLEKEHLDYIMSQNDNKAKEIALKHPKIDKKHMDNAMNDIVNDNLRKAVLVNRKVHPEHIDKGLNDFLSDVRMTAVQAKGISREQLNKALQDKHPGVRDKAKKRLETKDNVEKYIAMRAQRNANPR